MDKDGLTGLSLRAEYDEAIKAAKQSQMAIVYFDVNNLKQTNDTMGHKYGDKLLTTAAEAMKANFRENEIFRTGGDEFIVLMEGVGPKIIEKKLEKMSNRLKELTEADEDGVIYQVAAGYCVGDGALSKQEIVEKAEANMYINKKELKQKASLDKPIHTETNIKNSRPIEYRAVTKAPVRKAELPKDLNDNNKYIEKTFTSATAETILKCACIAGVFLAICGYLMFV